MEKLIKQLNDKVLAHGGDEGVTQKLVELSTELAGQTGYSVDGILGTVLSCVGQPKNTAITMLRYHVGKWS